MQTELLFDDAGADHAAPASDASAPVRPLSPPGAAEYFRTLPVAIRERLHAIHDLYLAWGQAEPESMRFLADSGHPHAAAYQEARSLFDRLGPAANAGSRYYAFRDPASYAIYWAPETGLTCEPGGWNGYHYVYPSEAERWDTYLQDAARAGFPPETGPTVTCGAWTVALKDERALAVLRTRLDAAEVPYSIGDPELMIRCPGLDALRAVVSAVDEVLASAVLPPRTPELTVADLAGVPLADRPLLHAGVERVTVNAHHVLVPLIPLGAEGARLLDEVLHDLLDLLDGGWSWHHAERYFERFLTADSFRSLKARYRPSSLPRRAHGAGDAHTEDLVQRVRELGAAAGRTRRTT